MSATTGSSTPPVIFLGQCRRAAVAGDGQIPIWNIQGLSSSVISFIYPLSFDNLTLGWAISPSLPHSPILIQITSEDGTEAGTITLNITAENQPPNPPPAPEKGSSPAVLVGVSAWAIVFASLPANPKIIIPAPGRYTLSIKTTESVQSIGEILFHEAIAAPLTPERIAAIQGDPTAAKAVRVETSCSICGDKLTAYAALERSPKLEGEGAFWYQSIPDVFQCKCGKSKTELGTIKRNLHGLLGNRASANEKTQFIPLYEKSSLESVVSNFIALLDKKPNEEPVQKFLENNPILLHQFSADRIFFKPAILTRYKADFAVLTSQSELLLIEIEKPELKLMKSDGGVGAELSHAYDQVSDWLSVAEEHRHAFLTEMGITRPVVRIRGVVIAGRDGKYDSQKLNKIKSRVRERTTFYTYDDLLFGMISLIRKLDALV